MTDISSLQQTVATAQEAFARTGEQHARSRKHLTGLINIVEENLREKRVALGQNEVQRERMIREYGQLRHMLHALVMTVEVGPREGLASIPAPAGAGPESCPESRMGPVPLDPAANDAGAARDGEDDPKKLRAGLKRMIKKKRAQDSQADEPKAPAPVT
ncbi:MAG: hypothetical protein IID48_11025 [Proteobacteria bacterium]|nr:hypothetical protein [Pseudomonadota bacterium]